MIEVAGSKNPNLLRLFLSHGGDPVAVANQGAVTALTRAFDLGMDISHGGMDRRRAFGAVSEFRLMQ